MTDEQLRREIQQLREDTKEGISGVHHAIRQLVSREVHDVQLERLQDRIVNVERDVVQAEAKMAEWERSEKERRESAQQNRLQDRRMVIAALLSVAASILVQILRTTGAI